MRALGMALGVVTLVAALNADAAGGKLYRWVDKDGHVHFSDQPAPAAQEVKAKLPNSADAATAVDADKQAADCQRKKDQLAAYRSAIKVSETNSIGQTREYSEDEKAKLIELTEKSVREACGESPG